MHLLTQAPCRNPTGTVTSPGVIPVCSMMTCGRDKCRGTASCSNIHPQTLKQLEGAERDPRSAFSNHFTQTQSWLRSVQTQTGNCCREKRTRLGIPLVPAQGWPARRGGKRSQKVCSDIQEGLSPKNLSTVVPSRAALTCQPLLVTVSASDLPLPLGASLSFGPHYPLPLCVS